MLRFWQYVHCLFRFHRAVTLRKGPVVIYRGCTCGRFWKIDSSEHTEYLRAVLRHRGMTATRAKDADFPPDPPPQRIHVTLGMV